MDPKQVKSSTAGDGQGGGPGATAPETTGRYIVLMRQDAVDSGVKFLSQKTGLKSVASSTDFEKSEMAGDEMSGAEVLVFDKLAVAVVDADPEQMQTLGPAAEPGGAILAIEPERVVYAFQGEGMRGMGRVASAPFPLRLTHGMDVGANQNIPVQYLQGYRDAVNSIIDKVLDAAGVGSQALPVGVEEAVIAAWDESEFTWGLQATKVAATRYSGKSIRIVVLDTGIDQQHPDFAGRRLTTRSFIANESVQDGHGHGTHCIGTACGPLHPQRLPRYGIAYESEIFAGKVLSNQGRGSDSGILAGIDWAITNNCHIVSMSLGADVAPNQAYSQIFEEVAQRALSAGTVIIAAAGNSSSRIGRPPYTAPVAHPANCPSIMAVAALDKQLQVAPFSSAGFNPVGGQVDIAAPGTNVISCWPQPQLYRSISGTSMATPHVAGIAALLAEATPGMRGRNLISLIMQSSRRLEASARDVGAGLVQAPLGPMTH